MVGVDKCMIDMYGYNSECYIICNEVTVYSGACREVLYKYSTYSM